MPLSSSHHCRLFQESPSPPALSVCLFTFRQEHLVRDTLDSLLPLNQGEEASGRTEIVASDDASPDGTAGVIAAWMERWGSRFAACRLLRGEENLGLVGNYNRAVRACAGEIVKPLAGDDLLVPGALGRLLELRHESSPEGILFGKVVPFRGPSPGCRGSDEEPLEVSRPPRTSWNREQRSFFGADGVHQLRTLVCCDPLPAPGALFRRSLFEDLRLWEHPFRWMEDWPLWLLASAGGRRLEALEEELVWYRLHESSVSQRMNRPGREKARRGINEDRRRLYDDLVTPLMGELPLWLRHHARLRRFFFRWQETTDHPGAVHFVRALSLVVDPHRLRRKLFPG